MDTYDNFGTTGYMDNIRSNVPSFVNKQNMIRLGVLAIVISVVYYGYKYLVDIATSNPFLIKGEKDGTKCTKVSGTRIIPSKIGHEFSYSFWVYVDDWGHNFNKPKHIFHVGDPEGKNVCPGIWLYPKTNNLMVRVDTYHNKSGDMNPNNNVSVIKKENPCDLVNIPVQRWVHICVVMINKTVDIYLNGKLARSCTLENVPKINEGDVHINNDGGMEGKIADLKYYNQAYSPQEVYGIYLSGPNSFDIMKYIGSYLEKNVPKVNLNFGIEVGDSSLNLEAGN